MFPKSFFLIKFRHVHSNLKKIKHFKNLASKKFQYRHKIKDLNRGKTKRQQNEIRLIVNRYLVIVPGDEKNYHVYGK